MSETPQPTRLSPELVAQIRAAYEAMSPVDRALLDADQRRSFLRGQTGRDPGPDVLAEEVRRLRRSLALADAACRTYWGWEYGPAGDNDAPDTRLLVEWAKDFNARGGDAKAG